MILKYMVDIARMINGKKKVSEALLITHYGPVLNIQELFIPIKILN